MGGTRDLNARNAALAFGLKGATPCSLQRTMSGQQENAVVSTAPALPVRLWDRTVELCRRRTPRPAFTDYVSNATAAEAAQELSAMPATQAEDNHGNVAPALCSRVFPGETIGPTSLSCASPQFFGCARIGSADGHLRSGHRLHDDPTTFQQVQMASIPDCSSSWIRKRRSSTWTRSRHIYPCGWLYQAYFPLPGA